MSLADIFTSDKKLICSYCKKEVTTYPKKDMKRGKFKCSFCHLNNKFNKSYDGIYTTFITWD